MTLENAYHAVFAGMSRQGPGSEASTRKALSLLPTVPEGTVLDLGCGTGASTLVLAEMLNRPILASDVNPASLDHLMARAKAAGTAERIETFTASADDTGQPPGSAGLIWCEGAIFTVGVEKGLRHWHPILKQGGVVAFTEMCWFGAERPDDAAAFLQQCYPPMTDVASLISIGLNCGYRLHATFAMPPSDWLDGYFIELKPAIEKYRGSDDPDIRAVLDICDTELDIAGRFLGYYGYVFVILTKA